MLLISAATMDPIRTLARWHPRRAMKSFDLQSMPKVAQVSMRQYRIFETCLVARKIFSRLCHTCFTCPGYYHRKPCACHTLCANAGTKYLQGRLYLQDCVHIKGTGCLPPPFLCHPISYKESNFISFFHLYHKQFTTSFARSCCLKCTPR